MTVAFQQLVNIIQLGSIYALLAIGFSIVYGISGLVNFAHGTVVMFGAYMIFFVSSLMYNITKSTLPVFVVSIITAAILSALLFVIIEKLAYKPLRSAPKVSVVVSSVGVGLILEYTMLNIFGAAAKRMPALFVNTQYDFFGVKTTSVKLLIIAVSIITMIVPNLFIKKSKIGVALRAVSQDPVAANFMGISTDTITSFSFAIGAVVGTIGAALYASSYPMIDPYMGDYINWCSFIAAVLGGVGSISGAMLGGYLLGAINIIAPLVLPVSSYKDIVSFGILIVALLIKPTGLLGKKVNQKV